MASLISLDSPLAPPLPIHRFTVEQYHQLGELGVLKPEDRVELLEGWIIKKLNQRPIHGFIVRLLCDLFLREMPDGWICQCQLPITTERSEPEPDIAILKGQHEDYRQRHPLGTDCRLVVEIADTSLEKDRAKASIYRDAGVEEYWIVNVAEKSLERYSFAADKSAEPEISQAEGMITITFGEQVVTVSLEQLFA